MCRISGVFLVSMILTMAAEGIDVTPQPASWVVPGEIILRLQPEASPEDIQSLQASYAVEPLRPLLLKGVEIWRAPSGAEQITARVLSEHSAVAWAEPNAVVLASATVPNDPYFASQWGHSRIASESAWDLHTGLDSVVVAIIDSGVDTVHPDLAGKIVPGFDFVDDDSVPDDAHGHGTHVAGIAAALTDNDTGIAGMSWGARIMPLRVLDADASGSSADVADAIVWAATNGADILNLSLGSTVHSQAIEDAVNAAHASGCLVVAAMGNFRTSGNPTAYPAALDNVLAVAATDHYDGIAWYSQYGSHCDVAAPGGELAYLHDSSGIRSTMPTSSCTLNGYGYSSSYDYLQGTSQATPFVSGLAALIWSVAPALSPDQVQDIIERTATDLGPAGWDADYGWGLIDAAAAAAEAESANPEIFQDGFESGDSQEWSYRSE
jgi:subtilisin family serine protease